MDRAFVQSRIEAAKAQLIAAEDAQLGIVSGAISTYTLDTGQGSTTVTKINIAVLNRFIDSLMNRIATYEARINGSGVSIARPRW